MPKVVYWEREPLRFLAIFVLSIIFAWSVHAEVKIYKLDRSPGIRTFETTYGESKKWNLECTQQTSGRELGGPSCRLEPWNGKIYPRTGIRQSPSDGIRAEVRGHRIEIDFLKKLRPGTPYSVECKGQEFSGTAPPKGARSESAFEGMQASRLLEAMMAADGCNYSYWVFGQVRPTTGYQQTIGLTDAVVYAKQWP